MGGRGNRNQGGITGISRQESGDMGDNCMAGGVEEKRRLIMAVLDVTG